MTLLEATVEKLKALPEDRLKAVSAYIDGLQPFPPRQTRPKATVEEIMALVREINADGPLKVWSDDDLYDEFGAPREDR